MRTLGLSDFQGETLVKAPGFAAVCFHADWCGFCARFVPAFEARSTDAGFPFHLADLSSEDDPRWETFGVQVVPTVILFKAGRAVWRAEAVLGIGLFDRDIVRMLAAAQKG